MSEDKKRARLKVSKLKGKSHSLGEPEKKSNTKASPHRARTEVGQGDTSFTNILLTPMSASKMHRRPLTRTRIGNNRRRGKNEEEGAVVATAGDSDNDSHATSKSFAEVAVTPGKKPGSPETGKIKAKKQYPKLNPMAQSNRKIRHQDSFASNRSRSRSRTYSKVIRNSLADVSQTSLARKVSISQRNKETEDAINEESDRKISRTTLKLFRHVPEKLSKKMIFDGKPYDDFDCFQKHDITRFAVNYFQDAFKSLELSLIYNDDRGFWSQFVKAVSRKYRNQEIVPFHSFFHGVSVAQVAVVFVVRSMFLKKTFDKKTLFTFVLAALCHDVDHPGNDNYFEIVNESENAKLFQNESVLENHHTKTTLDILKANNGDLNILKCLSIDNQEKMNEILVWLILATDMSKHKHHLEWLRELRSVDDLVYDADDSDADEKYNAQLELLYCLIHACDLSGQCFEERLACQWEANINLEMQNQYEKLKKKNLEIPKHLKHFEGGVTLKERYSSQSKFLQFVLIPYWTEVVRLFPEMNDFLDNLVSNQKFFEAH